MAVLTQDFFQKIIMIEGGFQDDPKDNGNYCNGQLIGTKYGMSAMAYGQWVGRCPSKEELKGATLETARDFYAWYFDHYKLYLIENQTLFQLCGNNTMGNPTQAAKCEQRALVSLGYPVAVDGDRGQQTIAALNRAVREKGLAAVFNAVRWQWVDFVGRVPNWGSQLVARMDRHFPKMPENGDGSPVSVPDRVEVAENTASSDEWFGSLVLMAVLLSAFNFSQKKARK